jgi:zinc protease
MVNSFISADDLASEMTVVRNEFEMGENDPTGVLLERVLSTAFLWHNYGKSTIGARSDIENVPIDRLQGFYRKYYQPDNAMLVVAGKFDPDTALTMIQGTFGRLPRPDRSGAMRIWPTYTLDPTQDGERHVTLRRIGDVQAVMMAWHVPHGAHPDFAAIDVLTHILGTSVTGRLYQDVVEPGLAARASAFNFQLREPGVLLATAQVRPEDDVAVAREAMLDAVEAVRTTAPVTDEEVDRGKASLLSGMERQLTDPNSVGLSMSEWAAMGDWRLLFLHRDRVRAVTAADVQRVANAYLKRSNLTLGTFLPDSAPDRAEMPEAPDLLAMVEGYRGDTAMAAGESFDPSPASLDARTVTTTLSNGIEVAFLPKATRGGTVALSLSLRFGSESALMNRGAVPGLTGQMLMRGTQRHTRQEIKDELDRLQAQVGMGGGATSASGSISVKREHLGEALRLALEILREPRFDSLEFALLKQSMLASLEESRSEPQALAAVTMQRHLSPWPKGHPNHVSTLEESIAEIEAATLEEVRAFHREFYGASRGQVAVVGNFDPDSVRAILEEGLADWESPARYARIVSPAGQSEPVDVTIETPDKANAMFFAARALPLRDDAGDYPAMVLADYLLGGGFLNSRLATRIRQQDGLSYGVGSVFQASPIDSTAMWVGYAIYAPENLGKLETAFREVLTGAANDGFSDEELAKAKEGWIESRKLGRSRDETIASRLTQNLFLDRTFAHDAALEAAVTGLTSADLQAAMRRWIDPDALGYIKAGDFRPKAAEAAVP